MTLLSQGQRALLIEVGDWLACSRCNRRAEKGETEPAAEPIDGLIVRACWLS